MNKNEPTLALTLLLLGTLPAAGAAQDTPPAPAAGATTPAPPAAAASSAATPAKPDPKQTDALKAAIQTAQLAMQAADAPRKRADLLTKLPNDTTFSDLNTTTEEQIKSVAGVVVDLKNLKTQLTAAKTNVDAQHNADTPGLLDNAITTNVNADPTVIANAKIVVTQIAATQDTLNALLGTKTDDGKLALAGKSFLAYLTKYEAAIRAAFDRTELNKNDIPDSGNVLSDDTRRQIRDRAAHRLPTLALALRHARLLQTQISALDKNAANLTGDLQIALPDWNTFKDTNDALNKDLLSCLETRLRVAFSVIKEDAESEIHSANNAHTAYLAKQENAVAIRSLLAEIDNVNADLADLQTGWNPFAAALKDTDDTTLRDDAGKLDVIAAQMLENAKLLKLRRLTLSTDIAGEMDRFVTEQVRLFYFTDIPRLMVALNSTAHILNADSTAIREAAKLARRQLTDADANLFEAQGKVSDFTTRIGQIQGEITKANNEYEAANRSALSATALVTQLTNQKTAYDTAHPNRAAGSAEDIQSQRYQADINTQSDRRDAAASAKNDADLKRQRLLDEKTGLPAQLETAKTSLSNWQEQVRTLRRASQIQVENENDAFIAERDNAPVWIGDAIAESHDPLLRVVLLAYEDSKVIFIRGLPDDVTYVKEIIAQYDRPAPQALITLWSLQLNGSNTRAFNDKLRKIREQIGGIQDNVVDLQEALRVSVKNEVNRVAETARKLTNADLITGRMARYFLYPSEIREQLGFVWTKNSEWHNAYDNATAAADLRLAAGYLRRLAISHLDLQSLQPVELAWMDSARRTIKRAAARLADADRIGSASLRQGEHAETQTPYQGKLLKPGTSTAYKLWLATPFNLPQSKSEEVYRVEFEDSDAKKALTDSLSGAARFAAQRWEEVQNAFVTGTSAANTGTGTASVSVAGKDTYQNTLNRFIVYLDGLADAADNAATKLADAADKEVMKDKKTRSETLANALPATEFVTRYTLPDPLKATTLGEMLFSVSLANRTSRARIYEEFTCRLAEQIARQQGLKRRDTLASFVRDSLYRFLPATSRAALTKLSDNHQKYQGIPQMVEVLFGDLTGDVDDIAEDEVTPNQMEILLALRTKARSDLAGEVLRLLNQINEMPLRLHYTDTADIYRHQYEYLLGWLVWSASPRTSTATDNFSEGPIAWGKEGKDAIANYADTESLEENNDIRLQDRAAWDIARIQSDLNPLSKATPRVAAADDMIKRMINAVQRDFETRFFHDALEIIEKSSEGRGVELGTIQRTSLLATNRLIARVDPVASAQAETSQTDNVLESAQQLAQIAAEFQGKSRTTGAAASLAASGLSAVAGATAASATGIGLLGLLSSLGSQTPPVGELYSLSTGNLFRVTPIFDPSGQAIRFQFDFTATAKVREPDGTTNPQLPRIERHTVNTEVQISNMELREISSFSTNTQIGRPERRGGGIPLLNQIPVVKEIPLIGYFYREAPANAKRQESLILAQTVVYPTVSDIADLLLEAHPLPVSPKPQPPAMVVLDSELIGQDALTAEPPQGKFGDRINLKVKLRYPTPHTVIMNLMANPPEAVTNLPASITFHAGEFEGTASFTIASRNTADSVQITISSGSEEGGQFGHTIPVSILLGEAKLLVAQNYKVPAIDNRPNLTGEVRLIGTVAEPVTLTRINETTDGNGQYYYRFDLPESAVLSGQKSVSLSVDTVLGERTFNVTVPDASLSIDSKLIAAGSAGRNS